MSQAKSKVRENGTAIRLYSDNSRDEVAKALAEMEAERAEADKEFGLLQENAEAA